METEIYNTSLVEHVENTRRDAIPSVSYDKV